MKKYNLNQMMAGTFAFLGVCCISTGVALPKMYAPADVTDKVVKLNVTQKKVANCKSNEIKLKNIELEINSPLSTSVKDYLVDPTDIENSIIKKLKLDTSKVNITEAGEYSYTITYNKKNFEGKIIIKNKEGQVNNITLNSLSYEVGTQLPTDISAYIQEALTDEIKAGIKIDTSAVDITKAGSYQYTVTYSGKTYTSNITIYEPKYGTNSSTVTVEGETSNVSQKEKQETATPATEEKTTTDTTTTEQTTDSSTTTDNQPKENS